MSVSVCLFVCLSVTEVHWRILANLGFKFRSHFTEHCPLCCCGRRATGGCNGGRRGSSIWGPISSSPTDRPWDPRRLASQHGEPSLLSRPRCSTGVSLPEVKPVLHRGLERSECSPCWEARRRGSQGRSVGEDDMGPQIEDPRLPPLHVNGDLQ